MRNAAQNTAFDPNIPISNPEPNHYDITLCPKVERLAIVKTIVGYIAVRHHMKYVTCMSLFFGSTVPIL